MSEAFQGVEATGDMAPKTCDNLLRNHRKPTEKEERILTATIHFLNGESDIWCLLHFGCLTVKSQSLVRFSTHFLLFSLNRFLMLALLKNSISREEG